jgi:hypothetical protein
LFALNGEDETIFLSGKNKAININRVWKINEMQHGHRFFIFTLFFFGG